MEIIDKLNGLLASELEEVKQLNDALSSLEARMLEEAGYIDKLDRMARLDAFKARLADKVYSIQQEEEISRRAFDGTKLPLSILGFAIGSIAGVISKQGNPLALGFGMFGNQLEKQSCFGMVMMGLKEGHKIKDIEVIAISRLARESNTTEVEIISSLEGQGYSLMTPEDFLEALDYMKQAIKEGGSFISPLLKTNPWFKLK